MPWYRLRDQRINWILDGRRRRRWVVMVKSYENMFSLICRNDILWGQLVFRFNLKMANHYYSAPVKPLPFSMRKIQFRVNALYTDSDIDLNCDGYIRAIILYCKSLNFPFGTLLALVVDVMSHPKQRRRTTSWWWRGWWEVLMIET